jgi:hypothetical protein
MAESSGIPDMKLPIHGKDHTSLYSPRETGILIDCEYLRIWSSFQFEWVHEQTDTLMLRNIKLTVCVYSFFQRNIPVRMKATDIRDLLDL